MSDKHIKSTRNKQEKKNHIFLNIYRSKTAGGNLVSLRFTSVQTQRFWFNLHTWSQRIMARSAGLLLLWFGSWMICSPQQCWRTERFGCQATRGRRTRLCLWLLFLYLDVLETSAPGEVLSRDDPHHFHLLPSNHQGLSLGQGGQHGYLVATSYTQTWTHTISI